MIKNSSSLNKSINGLERMVMPENLENFESIGEQYSEMLHLYQSATREITTKLRILDDEFQVTRKHNPIHHMQSRIKSLKSICEKLERKEHEVSLDSAKENLNDIAGIRVVCSYIEDIYMVAEMLAAQDDIIVVRQTDYIKNPKPNGYRSLHLVVKVPVFFSDRKELVPVEIQIRTIAMDFWASLEHQLRYKASDMIPVSVIEELYQCAATIAATDLKMQNIYRTMEKIKNSEDMNMFFE